MKLKNFAVLLLLATAPLGAQTTNTTPESLTRDIILRGGVFYPEHSVLGQSYYNGTWYQGAADFSSPDAFWRTTPEEVAANWGYADANDLARDWGYYLPGSENPTALANSFGYNNLEDMALNWGYWDYNSGTPNYNTLASYWGYSSMEDMANAYGYYVYGTGTPDPNLLANWWGYNTIEDYAAASQAYVDGTGTIDNMFAGQYGYENMQAWADAEAGGNLTTLANQYGYNSITDFAAANNYLQNGTPDLTKLANWNGYNTIEDMAMANGAAQNQTPDPEQLAQSWGYGNLDNMARSNGALDNPTPDTTGLANSFGYGDVNSWAMGYGYAQGSANDMFQAYGGIEAFAQSQGITTNKPAFTDAQKGSLLDAIQKGTLSQEDYNNLMNVKSGNGGNTYAFTKEDGTVDTDYMNTLVNMANSKGDNTLTDDTYQAIARTLVNSPDSAANVDLSGWTNIPDLNGFPINKSNLSWDQINSAPYANNADFSGMDMSEFVPVGNGWAYSGANFANTNITGAQLNAMTGTLNSMNLSGTDLTGFTAAGKQIQYINFQGTTGVTGTSLAGLTSLYGTNLTGINMAGFSTAVGANIYQTDFTTTTNFTPSSLNNASQIANCNFTGKNLTGLTLTSKNLGGTNFTNTTGLTAASLKTASNIQYIRLTGTGITRAQLAAQGISNSVLNTITF